MRITRLFNGADLVFPIIVQIDNIAKYIIKYCAITAIRAALLTLVVFSVQFSLRESSRIEHIGFINISQHRLTFNCRSMTFDICSRLRTEKLSVVQLNIPIKCEAIKCIHYDTR